MAATCSRYLSGKCIGRVISVRVIAVPAAVPAAMAASGALCDSRYTCGCFAVTRYATPLTGTPDVARANGSSLVSPLSYAGVGSGSMRVGCRRGCDRRDRDARGLRAGPRIAAPMRANDHVELNTFAEREKGR